MHVSPLTHHAHELILDLLLGDFNRSSTDIRFMKRRPSKHICMIASVKQINLSKGTEAKPFLCIIQRPAASRDEAFARLARLERSLKFMTLPVQEVSYKEILHTGIALIFERASKSLNDLDQATWLGGRGMRPFGCAHDIAVLKRAPD